jgi:hypothetical protein
VKKSVYGIILLLVILSMVSGCSNRSSDPTQAACQVVTHISITYENGPIHIQREYSHTEKMRAILHYLRWIDPYGTPEEDPDAAEGSLYKIIVRCANGTEKVYLQKADRFMRIGGGQWLKINPNNALTLSKMIGEMDSDVTI